MKRGLVLAVSCLFAMSAATVLGCEKDKQAHPPEEQAKHAKPTLRIYAVAGAAGAVEPCGCVKDMLGGIDHAAAFVASEKKNAPDSLVVGAGPMFFADPMVKKEEREQALFKAEAMAASLKDLGLSAWAPGANDWALGTSEFSTLVAGSGARALAGNLKESAGSVTATHLVKAGGLSVGLVGVSIPTYPTGKVEFAVGDAQEALSRGAEALKKQGAEIIVALVAAQRGEALRVLERTSGIQLAVIGKGFDQGEANDPQFSPEIVGGMLVAQAPNHLQGLSVVDLYVRDGQHSFSDGSGLETLERRMSLERRVAELKKRIADWKAPGSGAKESDVKRREGDLVALEKELAAIPEARVPETGSYFLYDLTEVRESHGADSRVASRLSAYYRRVNEHNKTAFADKIPRPAAEGQSSYIGIEACSNCHLEERAVWEKTGHSGAYETLTSGHKEFNLDCVSCHVTGYEKPGGSTVTHVENLTDVQCEVCHGPGSRHVENPGDKTLIVGSPSKSLCASACHHPPHVGPEWSVEAAWPLILGPGHGREKKK